MFSPNSLDGIGNDFGKFTHLVHKIYEDKSKLLVGIFFPNNGMRSLEHPSKHSFWGHILFLKRIFFCERGDFCKALISSLSSELTKPSSQVYRHNLVGAIDSIINEFLCPYEQPWLTGRLDVRLLKVTPVHDRSFSLEALRRKQDGNPLLLIIRSIHRSICYLLGP